MNDQDQYRRMILTTTQFEATLNHHGIKGAPIIVSGTKYKTIYAQKGKTTDVRKNKDFTSPRHRPNYFIDETEKWWK